MLTSLTDIPYSGATFQKNVGADHYSILTGFYRALPICGWTEQAQTYATARVPYMILPTISNTTVVLPKRTVTCHVHPYVTLEFDGIRYTGYDPYKETSLQSPTCRMFELGLTSAATLANLAGAIIVGRTGVPFTGSVDGSTLVLTSQFAGPIGNGVTGSADGRIATASGFISGGGGYQFRSVQGVDGIGQVHTTQYDAFITGEGVTANSVKVQFKFRLTTGVGTYQDVTYSLDTEGVYWNHTGFSKYSRNSSSQSTIPITGYTILSNPYSFAAFDGSEDAGNSWARKCSIFACAPYVPTTEGFIGNQRAFFVANTGIRNKTWYVTGAAQLNAVPYNVIDTRSYIRLLALRSPSTALLGSNNAPISSNAWVMFGRNSTDQQVVVGKIWDCAMVGDKVGGGLILDGQQFIRVSQIGGSGNRTPSSLVFRVPPPNQEL